MEPRGKPRGKLLKPCNKSEISGFQLNRLLVLAKRPETRPNVAETQVQELVEAEFSRLMRKGVFSFGWTASNVLD